MNEPRPDRARRHLLLRTAFERESPAWSGSFSFRYSDPDPAARLAHRDAALEKLLALNVQARPSVLEYELTVQLDPDVADRAIAVVLDENGTHGTRASLLPPRAAARTAE